MQRLQREVDRLFSGVSLPYARYFRAVNIWTGENDLLVTAQLPGIDPKELDISVLDDTLTLSGSRTLAQLKEGEIYHRQERGHGRFTRTITLPFRVKAENVSAAYEKGVLRIVLPRAEEDKPRKIVVKSES
jgi:HSP20 family protein